MKPVHRAAILSLLAPAILWAAPARAADSGRDLWTGFYLGAQGGYQGFLVDPNLCLVDAAGKNCGYGKNFDDISLDGGQVGLYAGYNYRIDPVVIGLEGDLNWGGGETSGRDQGIAYDMTAGGEGALRARLGWLVGERTLFYGTGGVSWIGEQFKITNCDQVLKGATCGDDGDASVGWQVGAGIEYFATDRLSLKAEYLYGIYSGSDMTLARSGDTHIDNRNDLNTSTLRLGVSYHFNGQ